MWHCCVLLVGLRDNRQICHASFLKHTGCKQMGFVTIVHFRSNNHCQLPTLTSMGKMLHESIKIDKLTKAKQNKTHLYVYFMRYIVYRNDGYCRISAQVYFCRRQCTAASHYMDDRYIGCTRSTTNTYTPHKTCSFNNSPSLMFLYWAFPLDFTRWTIAMDMACR